jgi:hypothetical protein
MKYTICPVCGANIANLNEVLPGSHPEEPCDPANNPNWTLYAKHEYADEYQKSNRHILMDRQTRQFIGEYTKTEPDRWPCDGCTVKFDQAINEEEVNCYKTCPDWKKWRESKGDGK